MDQCITRCNSPSHPLFFCLLILWKFTPVIDFPITPYQGITESQSIFIHKHFDPTPSLEFSLEFSVGTFWDHDLDVQHCIEFAISKQVQILSVIAHLLPEEHCLLPNMLYSHDNIRWLEHVSLKVFFFFFNPDPPSVLPFASLKTLCSLIVGSMMKL